MALAASQLEAAASGDTARLARLLRTPSVRVNAQDEHGNTALHEAAWKGYSRCVALLAAQGADVHIKNFGGFAALHLACQNGHNQSCREILLAGCDPDLQNNYGDTSLHTSARYGHAGTMRILISAACSVSQQNKNGDTALHIAAAMGRRKLTRILLEAGCDKSLTNKQDETARDIAKRKDLKEILDILNIPASKPKRNKVKHVDASKESTLDEPDTKHKNKENSETTNSKRHKKKKKSVNFEPAQKWSPYGCHYYPDSKSFPKPKLNSLPNEPLNKGEQYYLDLAGNICKGPVGVGYTCYCAPFFKHMEEKLNKDKLELKQHMEQAHQQLDRKVTNLENKTMGQISELTKCVAAERVLCRERHLHLQHWLTRGMHFRASERLERLKFDKDSLNLQPIKRTRSLEFLDTSSKRRQKVNNIIQKFNQHTEEFQSGPGGLHNDLRNTSRSADLLESIFNDELPPYLRAKMEVRSSSGSAEILDRSSSHNRCRSSSRSSTNNYTYSPIQENQKQNSDRVPADIHITSNNLFADHSPVPVPNCNTGLPSLNQSNVNKRDLLNNIIRVEPDNLSTNAAVWKSEVLQRTANDVTRRGMLQTALPHSLKGTENTGHFLKNIPQKRYIGIHNDDAMPGHPYRQVSKCEQFLDNAGDKPRISVQELVARVEDQQTNSTRNMLYMSAEDKHRSESLVETEAQRLLSMTEQPLRPAPAYKGNAQQKTYTPNKFTAENLIPHPVRKTFNLTANVDGNHSESSEDDILLMPSKKIPGEVRNASLLQTLPLPNYEQVSSCQYRQLQPVNMRNSILTPKDAYFHEIPNRPKGIDQNMNISGLLNESFPNENYSLHNHTLLQPCKKNINLSRNRNPLYSATGLFDAMMQDHMVRETERLPHFEGRHLDAENMNNIPNVRADQHSQYSHNTIGLPTQNVPPPNASDTHQQGVQNTLQLPSDEQLYNHFQSLAINTQLSGMQSQSRGASNDSGYSTKLYNSSIEPSPGSSNPPQIASSLRHRLQH